MKMIKLNIDFIKYHDSQSSPLCAHEIFFSSTEFCSQISN